MTAPLLRMCRYDSISGDTRQPEPACRGEHRVALSAGPELGVEVLGPAELEYFFEKTDITREQDKPIPIGGQ
jgi:hypothetical protein